MEHEGQTTIGNFAPTKPHVIMRNVSHLALQTAVTDFMIRHRLQHDLEVLERHCDETNQIMPGLLKPPGELFALPESRKTLVLSPVFNLWSGKSRVPRVQETTV